MLVGVLLTAVAVCP